MKRRNALALIVGTPLASCIPQYLPSKSGNKKLHTIIISYQKSVAKSCAMIFHDLGVAPPSSANEWALSNYNSKLGSMNRDGWEYYKHGYGCRVVYPGGEVDFDFGKDGEIDGLDLYKVWDFVERSKHDFAVSSIEELKAEFENSTRKGELVHEGYAMYHLKS